MVLAKILKDIWGKLKNSFIGECFYLPMKPKGLITTGHASFDEMEFLKEGFVELLLSFPHSVTEWILVRLINLSKLCVHSDVPGWIHFRSTKKLYQ